MSHLESIGFNINSSEEFEVLMAKVNGKTKRLEVKNQGLAFVAFPTEIAYFETAEAFVLAMPELSATYFIPVGLMTPEGTLTDSPEPYAMFIGEIKSVERKTNSYSNQEFYVFELSALEGDITVVASIKSLNSEAKVGGFINGVYWIGAKV